MKGYGFLSENAVFARKVKEAGLTFVGPPAHLIEQMGDKTSARKLGSNCKHTGNVCDIHQSIFVAEAAGVPVVPGSDGPVKTVADAERFVQKHGLPVIIKAAMGGGGRGMRVVRDVKQLSDSFQRAQSEALQSFGDGTVFLERFLDRPKHIEVQLLGDSHVRLRRIG